MLDPKTCIFIEKKQRFLAHVKHVKHCVAGLLENMGGDY